MTYRRAQLDADIKALSADYAARRGLDAYDHSALLEETYPLETKTKTDPADRYPTPDSYQPPMRGMARLPRPATFFDRAAYEVKVAALRADGYMSLQDALPHTRKSLYTLRQDTRAGHLVTVDAIGFFQRGLSMPRYFITRAELDRYNAWCEAGRLTADKHKPTSKRGAIAQEGVARQTSKGYDQRRPSKPAYLRYFTNKARGHSS